MKYPARYCVAFITILSFCLLTAIAPCVQSNPQSLSFGSCKPVSERTAEEGCWILINKQVGTITEAQVFWHLDVYPSRAQADKAKGPRGMVVESLGKVWLLSIEKEGWRPALKGERIGEIGPLKITPGEQYSAVFMESVSAPGKNSPAHTHPGPEAWYTLAGETCLETPNGKLIGRAGGAPVVVPAGEPMLLTVTGTEQRRALTLILYESAKPAAAPIRDWTPKGLCKVSQAESRPASSEQSR